MLAAKAALAIRVDALGDNADSTVGLDGRQKVGGMEGGGGGGEGKIGLGGRVYMVDRWRGGA